MSVIIRLQNLPWSANALDIRQFFKGLSIPDGGVHIVGGEMGDAFIAFSTDEDARQAMMHDRKKINEVQVRLLLSSRAEMQKVIETARQQSLLALKNAAALGALKAAAINVAPQAAPQPPVITPNSLHNILSTSAAPSFLAYQKQAGITLIEPPATTRTPPTENTNITETTTTSSSTTYRGSSSTTEKSSRDRRRSSSRDRRRSRSRDRSDRGDRNSSRRSGRRDRSRSRSRERDWKSRRSNRRSRSRDRTHDERVNRDPRSIDRNADRNPDRNNERSRNTSSRSGNTSSSNRERDNNRDVSSSNNKTSSTSATAKFTDMNENSNSAKVASVSSSWSIPPAMNAYQTNTGDAAAAPQQSAPLSFPLAPTSASLMLNPFSMGGAGATIPGLRTTPQLANSYTTSTGAASNKSAAEVQASMAAMNQVTNPNTIPAFQNYTTSLSSTNNYSINLFSTTSSNTLQNPYTAAVQQQTSAMNSPKSPLETAANSATTSTQPSSNTPSNTMFPGLSLMDKPTPVQQAPNPTTTATATPLNQLPQEPIAFANTNPYEQMYPNLFAQAAAAQSMAKPSGIQQNNRARNEQLETQFTGMRNQNDQPSGESCCIKISNMSASTTYSDIRKFCVGQFIPHNGIKMVNDKHGMRTGVAYIQFSRISSVHKAMTRNNSSLRGNIVRIEMVSEEEFEHAEDSYRPQSSRFERGNYNDRSERNERNEQRNNYQDNRNNNERQHYDDNNSDGGGCVEGGNDNYRRENRDYEPYTVLYIEDLPSSAVEHDIMRMFSSYTVYDILLTPSRENRREFKAYVLFSRAEEAKAALEDRSTHMIGYRKVRVSPGSVEGMEREKEKLRLANEQLMKEEEALAEAERLKGEENIGGEDDMDVANDDDDNNDNNDDNDNNIDDGGENIYNDNDAVPQEIDDEIEQQQQQQGQPPQQYHNPADPRIAKIPSLFELPPIKSEDLLKPDDDVRSAGPSDPRLRRQKRSRFEPLKQDDDQSMNDAGNNMIGMNNGPPMGMGMNDGAMGGMGMNDGPMGMGGGGGGMGMNDGPMGMGGGGAGGMGMNDGPMGMRGMNDGPMGMGGGGMGMNDGPMGMNNNNNNNNMGMNNNGNNNNNMNNMNMNFNNNNNTIEHNFILMKNCDYNTRMNDVADLLQSAFLRLKHIEPLRGERNMPTGEFIVEFLDARDAETAVRRFNNHTLRQRKLRIRPIMPQEIADRIGKPFMNCVPGGGGGGGVGGGNDRNPFSNNNDGPASSAYSGGSSSGAGGGGRYGSNSMDNDNNSGSNNNGRGGGGPMMSRGGSRNNMGAGAGGSGRSERSDRDAGSSSSRNRGGRFNNSTSSHDGHSDDDVVQVIDDSSNDVIETKPNQSGSGVDDDDDNGGMPQKFTLPGCVVAMENVPYKADLSDILKFFSGYDLTPDDIIRRFNDDGTPTGDARVAFASPSMARQAYSSRRRKQIFGRTIRLTML